MENNTTQVELVELDEWDFKMIDYAKSLTPSVAGFKKIWSERTNIDIDYCYSDYLVVHWLPIIERLKLKSLVDLICDGNPEQFWKYGLSEENAAKADYFTGWFYLIFRVLRHTQVAQLPGYQEWVDAKKRTGAK